MGRHVYRSCCLAQPTPRSHVQVQMPCVHVHLSSSGVGIRKHAALAGVQYWRFCDAYVVGMRSGKIRTRLPGGSLCSLCIARNVCKALERTLFAPIKLQADTRFASGTNVDNVKHLAIGF